MTLPPAAAQEGRMDTLGSEPGLGARTAAGGGGGGEEDVEVSE